MYDMLDPISSLTLGARFNHIIRGIISPAVVFAVAAEVLLTTPDLLGGDP